MQKIGIEFPKVPGCQKAYQVLWFGNGATCTLKCMLRVLVVVHISNMSSGYGEYNNTDKST